MVFVLMITSLLFIFGISLLGLTLSEYRITYAYANISKAEYLAESGLNQVLYALTSSADEIENSIKAAINNIKRDSYGTDKQWIGAKVDGANKAFNDGLGRIKTSINFNQPIDVYTDGHFSVNKIDVIGVSDINTYHDVWHDDRHHDWIEEDVLIGSDENHYYNFSISVETEGVYQNVTRKGTAELEFHFDKSQDDGLAEIKSWKIE